MRLGLPLCDEEEGEAASRGAREGKKEMYERTFMRSLRLEDFILFDVLLI